MIIYKLVALGLVVSNSVTGQPYTLPNSWPSTNELQMIDGALLSDPLVVNAMAQVKAMVPPQYLNIPPATFISGANVNYNSDPVANCYWPKTLCVRSTDTANWKADITKCPGDNAWGLTYDDGPTVNLINGVHTDDTGAIRDALANANLKATFFVVGSNAIQNLNEIILTHQAGHQIALHTWSHHPLTSLTNEQIVAELKYNEAIIYKATGLLPIYFRPPYGDIDDRVRAIVNALGYKIVIWTTNPSRDSGDADVAPSSDQKVAIENKVNTWFVSQPGFVSLEHDISTFTSNIAVGIINNIGSKGASFPLYPMPVGTCMNDANWYANSAPPVTITSLTQTTTQATSATTTKSITPTTSQPTLTTTAKSTTTGSTGLSTGSTTQSLSTHLTSSTSQPTTTYSSGATSTHNPVWYAIVLAVVVDGIAQ